MPDAQVVLQVEPTQPWPTLSEEMLCPEFLICSKNKDRGEHHMYIAQRRAQRRARGEVVQVVDQILGPFAGPRRAISLSTVHAAARHRRNTACGRGALHTITRSADVDFDYTPRSTIVKHHCSLIISTCRIHTVAIHHKSSHAATLTQVRSSP